MANEANNTIELNKVVSMDSATAVAKLEAYKKAEFGTISQGLGLKDGEYQFTTRENNHLGIMGVQTRDKSRKLALTAVFGTATSENGTSDKFDEQRLCVIPQNLWSDVTPSTGYKMTVSNGYVTDFKLLSGSVEATKSNDSEVSVDDAKTWLKANAGYKAKDLKDMSDAEILEAYNDEQ